MKKQLFVFETDLVTAQIDNNVMRHYYINENKDINEKC